MGRQDYINNLLHHFESPKHFGALADADATASAANVSCGDVIVIHMQVNQADGTVTVQFEGEGCTISQGATSILLDMVQGKPLAEIETIDHNDILDIIGRDVVLTRVPCATLGLSALKKAIQNYRAKHPIQTNGELQ